MIDELKQYDQLEFEQLKLLIEELTDRVELTPATLAAVLDDANCHLYVIKMDERIIGCATLCLYHSPTGTKGTIEDVVVSSAYRGQDLGRQLMEYVLEQAKQYAPLDIYLTSKPKRVAANNLYQSLGFQRKETNCYSFSMGDC